MTAKQFLNRAYHLNNLIDSKLAELDKLKDLRFNISGNTSGVAVQASKETTGAKYTSIVDKIVEQEEQLNKEVDKLVDLRAEISGVINSLDDVHEQNVLRMRYLSYMKFNEISHKLNYSTQHIFRIHKRGLKNIEIFLKMRVNES